MGLVAEYHFNGDATDSSGNGNNGVINGATFVPGVSGQALSFDGVDDFIRAGDILDSTFTGANSRFTIGAWIKPGAVNDVVIVAKSADSRHAEDQRQFYFLFAESKLNFHWDGNLDGSSYRGVIGSSVFSDLNKWYNVVAVYDGTKAVDSRVSLYVNGIAETTTIRLSLGNPSSIPDGTAQLGIGAAVNSAGTLSRYNFNGTIDEVRIYNRALSADEIKAEYDKIASPPPPPVPELPTIVLLTFSVIGLLFVLRRRR